MSTYNPFSASYKCSIFKVYFGFPKNGDDANRLASLALKLDRIDEKREVI